MYNPYRKAPDIIFWRLIMTTQTDNLLLVQIGKIIKRKRSKTKYSQSDLADKLETSQAAVCRYEKGKTNLPVLTLKHIADECGFDMIDYFIEIDNPSVMYKKIVSPENYVPEIRTKADIEFDKIMKKPENTDKVKALYYLSEISSVMPSTLVNYTDIAQTILIEQTAQNAQRKRLLAYFEKFASLQNK